MINAREEFERHVDGSEVLCAKISFFPGGSWDGNKDEDDHTIIVLHKTYTEDDYETFLDSLNFEYREDYEIQYLYGMIWYLDGTWSTRIVSENIEQWFHHERPEIPEECGGEDTLIKGSGRY